MIGERAERNPPINSWVLGEPHRYGAMESGLKGAP